MERKTPGESFASRLQNGLNALSTNEALIALTKRPLRDITELPAEDKDFEEKLTQFSTEYFSVKQEMFDIRDSFNTDQSAENVEDLNRRMDEVRLRYDKLVGGVSQYLP